MTLEHEFTEHDLQRAAKEGIPETELINQLNTLRKGLTPARASRVCKVGDGILSLSHEEMDDLIRHYNQAQPLGRFSKMVPASGAATRMFKFVFNVANGQEQDDDFHMLKSNLKSFPFYKELQSLTSPILPEDLESKELAKAILNNLEFGSLPKAFIPFHAYPDHINTAMDEHFKDSTLFLQDQQGLICLHFTIDPQFVEEFKERLLKHMGDEHIQFQVSHSVQKPSTQTIAMSEDGTAARTGSGELLFRPGGHGSLLINLQEVARDIVFLQNIDNVGREEHHAERIRYKKILGGLLVKIEAQITDYLEHLDSTNLSDIWAFSKTYLGTSPSDEILAKTRNEQIDLIRSIFNRPIRVCGMVKNEGEPGGGPFWTAGLFQTCQILEKAQLDLNDPEQLEILESATHFNPVDLVCGLRNRNGEPFDLSNFKDPDTCFISQKSVNGETIYALEHPGLWNGGMANWNTVFVEVPLFTFSPVKTVNDLIRENHQP